MLSHTPRDSIFLPSFTATVALDLQAISEPSANAAILSPASFPIPQFGHSGNVVEYSLRVFTVA